MTTHIYVYCWAATSSGCRQCYSCKGGRFLGDLVINLFSHSGQRMCSIVKDPLVWVKLHKHPILAQQSYISHNATQ